MRVAFLIAAQIVLDLPLSVIVRYATFLLLQPKNKTAITITHIPYVKFTIRFSASANLRSLSTSIRSKSSRFFLSSSYQEKLRLKCLKNDKRRVALIILLWQLIFSSRHYFVFQAPLTSAFPLFA